MVIPNKGALSRPSKLLVKCLGFNGSLEGREYLSNNDNGHIKLIQARARDIPKYVEKGIADIGITGEDIVAEEGSDIEVRLRLPFGACRLVYAIKKDGPGEVKKVATSFPNLASKYLARKGISAEIIRLNGAVEASVKSGIAGAIIDLTATGKTLEENGLAVADELFTSTAVVISRKNNESAVEAGISQVIFELRNEWSVFSSPLGALSKEQRTRLLNRNETVSEKARSLVREIFEAVRIDRDDALVQFTQEFDGVKLKPKEFEVTRDEIKEAYSKTPLEVIEALKQSSENIARFAKKELPKRWEIKTEGGFMGKRIVPLDSVGVYAPGGTAAYPSSVLMGVTPAKVAGVPTIVLCTPCNKEKKCNPAVLVAADIAGVTRIFRMGGAQAMAAMALGTRTVPKTQKIVGPGNVFVNAAKLEAASKGVAIDLPAGPTEVLIIADETANASFVAADLLAQAEHDVNAAPILVTTSERLSGDVREELRNQSLLLPRKEIARKAFENNGAILIAKDVEEAIEFVNEYAPEHLELVVERPVAWMEKVRNAGAIFLGSYSCEALGDYIAGPNHVLPTGGTAKAYSGLSARDFVKEINYMKFEKRGLEVLKEKIIALAEAEGLEAHANSVKKRFERD